MEFKFKTNKDKKVHYAKIDSGFNIEPSKHWKILFYFGLGLLFVFLSFSWYLYSRFDGSDEIKNLDLNQTQTKSLKIDEIQKTVDYFKIKKDNFEILQKTAPIVVDPRI